MPGPDEEGSGLAALAKEGRERRAAREREASRPLRERNLEASASIWFSHALPSHSGWGLVGVALCLGCMVTTGLGVWAWGWGIGMIGLVATFVGVWALQMREVSRELAWCDALPFVLDGYVETIGAAPVSPARLCVELSFVDQAPASGTIGDALAVVDPAARVEAGAPMVLVNGPLVCDLGEAHANAPVRGWLRALVERVLCPLHREFPLARVVVRRAV